MKSILTYFSQVHSVTTFPELIETPFQGKTNALCWTRDLQGDFQEIIKKLELTDNITELSADDLLQLSLTTQGCIARDTILSDMQLLTDIGALPSLNLIKHYERDNELDFISTDVYSFHVDRSPIATDTFLCTYYGAASDILPNDQVQQKIQIPEIRIQLFNLYDGPETGFDSFLEEYFFDLHYQANDNAVPINLGTGHLWRLAVDHPTQQVLPCVHRAPVENDQLRLLLIC